MSLPAVCGLPFADAWMKDGFCATELSIGVGRPRSVVALGTTDMLVLEKDTQSVVYIRDTDGDGWVDDRLRLASAPDLNHGLAVHGGYVYASSDSTVYRWPWQVEDTTVGSREVVINNINPDGMGGAPGGHKTRTLAFDEQGRIYVSVGSGGNVDVNSFRSRIRRFDFSTCPTLPIDFLTGEVFADGLRNEVGLAFDRHGILWGVENGADELTRSDLGGDIHNENPGEELNRFKESDAGKSWGYPYCWSEFFIDEPHGLGQGTVWAWPSFLDEYSDETCRSDYMRSELSMQAHSAPLGIVFYEYKNPSELPDECVDGGAFPQEMDGYAFIAFHGSWNRDVPTGYKVVYVAMDANGNVVGQAQDLLRHDGANAKWPSGYRPVDVDFDTCGRLIVTSDGSDGNGDNIVRISSTVLQAPAPTVTPTTHSPSKSPSSSPSETTNRPSPLSGSPTGKPSATKTTEMPTDDEDTNQPSSQPSNPPSTIQPSYIPSSRPSMTPTTSSLQPSYFPTMTIEPSILPTLHPSFFPTSEPSESNNPTNIFAPSESNNPTNISEPSESNNPTNIPSDAPTSTPSNVTNSVGDPSATPTAEDCIQSPGPTSASARCRVSVLFGLGASIAISSLLIS